MVSRISWFIVLYIYFYWEYSFNLDDWGKENEKKRFVAIFSNAYSNKLTESTLKKKLKDSKTIMAIIRTKNKIFLKINVSMRKIS